MSVDLSCLSPRELEVSEMIALGTTPKMIAERLGVGVKTISTYRARIFEKLGVRSNAEVATLHAKAALARAANHTLIASALCAGVARWISHAPSSTGELVVDSLRYITQLDAAGVPEIHPVLRDALAAAMQRQRSAAAQAVAA